MECPQNFNWGCGGCIKYNDCEPKGIVEKRYKKEKDWYVLTQYGLMYDFSSKKEAIEFAEKHGFTFGGAKRGSDSWEGA